VTGDAWDALLAGLRTLGPVEEVAPGRTVVAHEGRTVTIVMAPEDWDDLVSIPYGAIAPAVADICEQVRTADSSYLVYERYELHPSETPEPSPDPAEARIDEWMREHPGQVAGKWYASPPDRG
jgi:hypothetical protein